MTVRRRVDWQDSQPTSTLFAPTGARSDTARELLNQRTEHAFDGTVKPRSRGGAVPQARQSATKRAPE
jgi:hypothetical protein